VKAKNMPLMSPREVLKLKLDSIPFPQLKEFASMSGISKGRKTEIIKEILQKGVDEKIVDRCRFSETLKPLVISLLVIALLHFTPTAYFS
jgi:hypothetical protein